MIGAEFGASRAREITNNCEKLSCEIWYIKFKDELFYQVNQAALKGHDHLALLEDNWNKNKYRLDYLIKRLKELDYQVDLRKEELIISW